MHGQELVELRVRVGADADSHVSDVLVGVDPVEQAGAAQGLQDGEVVPALLMPDEEEILPVMQSSA